MKFTNYILISLVFMFVYENSQSQNLLKSINATEYTYVYKLDNVSALEILKGYQIKDSAKYFTHLVDSFRNDKPENYKNRLSVGQYILYRATGKTLYFNLLEISNIVVKANGLNKSTHIYVYDLDGNPINDNVKLYTKKDELIPFDENLKCWAIPNQKFTTQYFYIINDSALTYYELRRNNLNSKKSHNTKNRTTLLPGYLVLNQPSYKINDSLIFKAFLLKKNGKPYKKDILLKIQNSHYSILYLEKELKPLSKGAYSFGLQIPDSFNLDADYRITLLSKKGYALRTKNFRVENYQTQNARFTAQLEKPYFYKGEKVYLHLGCFDANNLPLADTKIKMKLKISNMVDFYNDSMFIPYAWQSQSYWSQEIYSDPSGNTNILLPDSLFINALMDLYLEINFINSEGEYSNTTLSFKYNPQRERFLLYQSGDSIKAIYMENSEIKSKPAQIRAYNNKLLETKHVVLPYSFHIGEFPKYYSLFDDTIHIATLYPKSADQNLVSFVGYRNYDSLVLKLVNAAGVNIDYWIYQNNKIIIQGNSVDFSISKAIKGGKSIDIIYSYRLAGEKYTYVQSFHHKEKSLEIESDMPRIIYPGQEVVVKMRVKNHKGKYRKNVNLTAYAINAKMPGIESPDIPYFGKLKSDKFNAFPVYLSSLNITSQRQIDTNYIEWLNLRNTSYYNFTYSKDGYILQYDSIEKDATEFAPYLIKNGDFQKITEIYIDNKLAYFDKSGYPVPYSLRVNFGVHTIVLRSQNEFITIKNIEFRKGFKLFMGVEVDSIYKFSHMEYAKASPNYLDEEKAEINNYLMVFWNYITKPFYIVQENQIIKTPSHYNSFRNGNTIVGPLKPGKVNIITETLDTLVFYFQPGFIYLLTDTLITPKDAYNQNITNNIFYNRSVSNTGFEGYARAETIAKPKEKMRVIPKPKLNPYLNNYDMSHQLSTHGSLVIRNFSKRQIIRTWLINSTDSINSKYYSHARLHLGQAKPGDYLIYFLANDSSYFCKAVQITADGTNFRNFQDTTFQPYDSVLLKRIESLIVNLNTPKPKVFDSKPEPFDKYSAKTYKNQNNRTYFKGTVMDNYFNPVADAIILLEREGVFVKGAYTNQAGSFIISDSLEGKYQMKIFIGSKYYYHYNVFITSHLTTEVNIVLSNIIRGAFAYNDYTSDNYTSNVYGTYESAASYTSPMYIQNESKSLMEVTISSASIKRISSIGSNLTIKSIDLININDKEVENYTLTDSISLELNEEKSRYDDLKTNQKSNRIRSEFRDYGFFVPNLITNKKGEAYFTVQFPDNQTLWKAFFPAMDYRQNSGLLEIDIQAYKPLSASIALPQFLIEGDSVIVNGKITNYMGQAISLTPWYKIDQDSTSLKTTSPKHFEVFPKVVSFEEIGKKEITFGFKTQEGYLDAERRKIPVFVNGIEVSKSNHYYAKNDFVINYKANTNLVSRTIYITNNQLDVLNEEIEYLKNYGYGCNEQNASKIIALLAEKSIKKTLDLPFENEKLIKNIISKLEKTQNDDGSWGWWNRGEHAEIWMTIYIVDALNLATKAGYTSKAIFKAIGFLEASLKTMNTSDMLYAVDILCDFNSSEKYKPQIAKVEKLKLSNIDRFRLISIKQKMGLPYEIQEVIQSNNRDKYGTYWGESVMNFKVNIIQNSSLAYNILKREKGNHQVMLEETRNYFLTHLSKNRNTIERAVLLHDITDDIIANNSIKKEIRSELKINGKLMSQNYPLHLNFKNTEDIYIEKTGAPLQISVYETFIQNSPQKSDTIFELNSVFRKGNDTINSIKLGENFHHYGRFHVKKESEYVMIEIPIPAGAVFINKNSNKLPYEINREYHNDKVVIFFRRIPYGTYYFDIELSSRFAGQFNVIPSKISLMYFPDVIGVGNSHLFRITE
jgi:alpha-2-macroglobulin